MDQQNGNQPRSVIATVTRPGVVATDTKLRQSWTGEPATYYDLPLVKKAHWSWPVIAYFYLGGIGGGSYLVATLADFLGLNKDKNLMRAGRYLPLLCLLASPVLLIVDLGRPARFHHMLRILKFRSAMSLGTWGLTSFGLFCGLTAGYQMAKDGLLNWFPFMARLMKALPIKAVEAMGAFFGLFVASYTGVLLSSTAVPIWARAKHFLGPLFLTSGVSTGLSALSLILSFGPSKRDTLERLDRAEMIAMSTELGLIGALIPILGPLAKPLLRGRSGTFFVGGTIGIGLVLPLLLKLLTRLSGRHNSRTLMMGTSLLVLIGGFILRMEWIFAGRKSADDPHDTHYYNALE